jgi:hypothetical protein
MMQTDRADVSRSNLSRSREVVDIGRRVVVRRADQLSNNEEERRDHHDRAIFRVTVGSTAFHASKRLRFRTTGSNPKNADSAKCWQGLRESDAIAIRGPKRNRPRSAAGAICFIG